MLQGPVVCEWTLPLGAERIAASVEMPVQARTYGDCVVSVRVRAAGENPVDAGKPLWSVRVSGDAPSAAFNVVVPTQLRGAASTLVFEIAEGENGTVQDQVVLRKALVLVSESK